MLLTQPIRDEHRELLPHVESLRTAAEVVSDDSSSRPQVQDVLDRALDFLTGHLIPHATAEDEVLYPAVEQVMGAPGATRTMRRDHVEVVAFTEDVQRARDGLGEPVLPGQRRELEQLLYGLYAVVRLHFAKEEEVYLPVLDEGLTADTARELFHRMHEAAERAGGLQHA
ncbi:MAG TPA: hemerythrin domain-containing protein [Actinomycetes bacterium]